MKVQLVNITNSPIETIYKAYRICYSKLSYDDITLPHIDMKIGEENREIKDGRVMVDFIEKKLKLGHTSPLEHVSMTFNIEGISRACLAQLTRHRTGHYNVQSQRYVNAENFDFVMPDLDYIEDEGQKQIIKYHYEDVFRELMDEYERLIAKGVRKEDARAILPQATTCNLLVTFDLHNFRHFLKLRMDKSAQTEIRKLACIMCELVKEYIPFVDYEL